jgi:hypothetical protein
MRLINKADLFRRTFREVAGMQDEIKKEIAVCDRKRRTAYAALADIRTVQGQRKIMRPNL